MGTAASVDISGLEPQHSVYSHSSVISAPKTRQEQLYKVLTHPTTLLVAFLSPISCFLDPFF